ncbi:hypothetical protein LJC27_08490, partial [Christensenellaceae bacterium OttesenSCG-928-M15]|nr:hypothetical protein [Christensenellaceae bacterium OttesenSCG-928-M15]
MKSTLQELYDGEIYPAQSIIPDDAQYEILNSSIDVTEKYLSQRLSKEDQEKFEELSNMYNLTSSMLEEAAFMHGFQL